MRLAALQQKNGLILHDADSLSDASASHQLSSPTHPLSTALFEADYWQSRGLVVGEAPGRGSSLFLQARDHEQWVLRPYQRGGSSPRSASNAMSGWGQSAHERFVKCA